MNRLLTTFLVWILMAALPLHAVAASVRLSCAPTGHHTGAAAAPDAQQHAMHGAVADEHADIHAHHGGHDVPDADAATDSPDDDAATLSHSSCSACSVFCVGAVAPPSALLPLPSFDGSEAVVVAPADSVTGFIPDGLQRPPRP